MAKNEIQESRMKNYFITAAKEMIRGEGIKSISVRTISQRAGYSYATLYNYFKDLTELYYHCISDFSNECIDFVNAQSIEGKSFDEIIMIRTKAYINYFVQYPSTFELIFTERFDARVTTIKTHEIIEKMHEATLGSEWNKLIEKSADFSLQMKKEMHILTVNSILSSYLLRFSPSSYKEMLEKAEKIVKHLSK